MAQAYVILFAHCLVGSNGVFQKKLRGCLWQAEAKSLQPWFLAGQKYLGQAELTSIVLYDLGPYPAAKLRESQGVCVEVYEITDEALGRLDELEDYDPLSPESGLYNRVKLETPFSLAWLYIYNRDVTGCNEV